MRVMPKVVNEAAFALAESLLVMTYAANGYDPTASKWLPNSDTLGVWGNIDLAMRQALTMAFTEIDLSSAEGRDRFTDKVMWFNSFPVDSIVERSYETHESLKFSMSTLASDWAMEAMEEAIAKRDDYRAAGKEAFGKARAQQAIIDAIQDEFKF